MPLVDLTIRIEEDRLPGDVRTFLGEADQRIERFQFDNHIPGFVASDFKSAYWLLRALVREGIMGGNLFCEWGSGFGVVACMAAMLDFDACGIEIEPALVEAAQELAGDFELPVEFFCGSFIPADARTRLAGNEPYAWLTTDGASATEQFGLGPDDFDVIFAYPWPDEEELTGRLFERYAGMGALLVTHHASGDCRLRRKTGRKTTSR